jgi:hypothetical protein
MTYKEELVHACYCTHPIYELFFQCGTLLSTVGGIQHTFALPYVWDSVLQQKSWCRRNTSLALHNSEQPALFTISQLKKGQTQDQIGRFNCKDFAASKEE